jgi:hypothetical protein
MAGFFSNAGASCIGLRFQVAGGIANALLIRLIVSGYRLGGLQRSCKDYCNQRQSKTALKLCACSHDPVLHFIQYSLLGPLDPLFAE